MALFIDKIVEMMIRIIGILLTACAVSFYFFPFGFSFFPAGMNTKMMLALIGILLVVYQEGLKRQFRLSKDLMGAIAFAVIFSFICFIAIDYNHTDDYSYVTYFSSFFTWLGAAYTVCVLIRTLHGKATMKLLTSYLAGVCVAQCFFAIIIDRNPTFQRVVDTYIQQGQEFFQEVGRLYGIGAALDPAGVRFAIVLLMLAYLICQDESVRKDRWQISAYLFCFFTISILGNMISRTTSTGMVLGLIYLLLATGIFRFVIRVSHLKLYSILIVMFIIFGVLSVYFYHHDPIFYQNIRFAFEGFFNWVETGKWETDSTNKLNAEMWVWPQNLQQWVIGTGLFGFFVYGTDVGYCRFILYCGLSGFLVLASFFVYNTWMFVRKFPSCLLLSFLLLALSFIIWIKVATDLFFIYALFYCLDSESTQILQKDENNLLHSRNL